jgi:hypothetical protein
VDVGKGSAGVTAMSGVGDGVGNRGVALTDADLDWVTVATDLVDPVSMALSIGNGDGPVSPERVVDVES